VAKRYIRVTLTYSESVLLCALTKEASLLTSSKKALSGSHCSISMFLVG
jgi:hypothetical protein